MTVTSKQRARASAQGKDQPARAPALRTLPAWKALQKHHERTKNLHLRQLFADDPERGQRLAVEGAGIYLDYSKNRITDETLRLLIQLAQEAGLRKRIEAMFRGDAINVSENRAVLHIALRAPRGASIMHEGGMSFRRSMPFSTEWRILPIGCAAGPGRVIPASASATSSTSASAGPTSDR